MTGHVTSKDFAIPAGQERGCAAYFPSMDYIDYVRADGITISKRIDKFLTILLNEEGEMVGFKLKGIKNFFLTDLKPALSLMDSDFVFVRDAFVALMTRIGNEAFNDNQRVAYRHASQMAANDNVRFTVPDYAMAA